MQCKAPLHPRLPQTRKRRHRLRSSPVRRELRTRGQPLPVPVADNDRSRERDRLRQQFREGRLDDRLVELETRDRNQPQIEILSNQPPEEMDPGGLRDMLSGLFSQRTRKRQLKVAEAFDYLVQEEESRLLDMDQVTRIAVERVEDSGIVFLDEIDKIAGREGGHGPDISREGVQRDILPIVEGTTVNTKYGFVATDHILFIAAGAFHVSKPSDLIPELQGRFPIRVELKPLTVEDFLRILTGASRVAGQAIHRASGNRGPQARIRPGGAGGDGPICLPGEREHRKHWRAPPAHHYGEGARRDQLPCSRPREAACELRRREET